VKQSAAGNRRVSLGQGTASQRHYSVDELSALGMIARVVRRPFLIEPAWSSSSSIDLESTLIVFSKIPEAVAE
jgi:hypothetical protein